MGAVATSDEILTQPIRNRPLAPPRAQFTGQLRFLCPQCGNIATYRLQPGTYKIRCTKNECRKFWILGFVVRPLIQSYPFSSAEMPSDMYFPTGDLDPLPWRSGDPIHKLITSEMQERQPARAQTAPESSE